MELAIQMDALVAKHFSTVQLRPDTTMAADEESKILILPESHEGKLVTKLSNDQLKVLTCRITIDPKDQSKEVHKYKEVYEIDADARIKE